jgi:hypothetical protein
MNKRQFVSFLIVISLIASCNGTKKDKISIKSIEILYLKGTVCTTSSINWGAISSMIPKLINDTFLFDETKLKEMEHQISIIKELKMDSTTSRGCDVRIECKINLKNGKIITLCLSEFNCLIKDDKRIARNDTLIYLIKRYSGYYNYFRKEDLIYFDELKLFGIPNDYRDLRKKNTSTNGIPLPPE